MRVLRFGLWLVFLFALVLAACGPETPNYVYRQPDEIGNGFEVGTLDQAGLDPNRIGLVVDQIEEGAYGEIHSLLIYRDGKLVFEEYFPGHDYQWDSPNFHGAWVDWDVDRVHNIHSVGKSITSACIGIAIEEGFIGSVHDSIFDYLPEYQYLNVDGKGQITIEHLLTMSSGLEWDEWGTSYSDSSNDVIALWLDCDDPIECILERPLVSEPGSTFTYSGGNMVVLGEILKNATGMDIEAFSWKYLFAPLGIEDPAWSWINDEVIYAGGDQLLTPRAMLKFGVLYLNGGVWDGQRILPEAWVENSARPYYGPGNTWLNTPVNPMPPSDDTWGQRGYAYSWWTHEFEHDGETIHAMWATGFGGQNIFVLPESDMVVVVTAANYNLADPSVKILKNYILQAVD